MTLAKRGFVCSGGDGPERLADEPDEKGVQEGSSRTSSDGGFLGTPRGSVTVVSVGRLRWDKGREVVLSFRVRSFLERRTSEW